MSDFVCNSVDCDWLTLTSYSLTAYEQISAYLADTFRANGSAKRMQYTGRRALDAGVFWGEGVQGGKNHYMVQVSGVWAGRVLLEMLQSDPLIDSTKWHCTRIDIQLTLLIDDYHLSGWEWVKRSGGRQVTHLSSGGMDTVYLGSRQGDSFCRVYVKDTLRDDVAIYGQFIRVEFELKGDRAKQVFRLVRSRLQTLTDIWADCFMGVTGRKERVKGYGDVFCPIVLNAFSLPKAEPVVYEKRESDTIRWLKGDVTSAIKKQLNDDSNRQVMIAIIAYWQGLVDGLEGGG